MWDPSAYHYSIELFYKLLGFVFIWVWTPFLFQMHGLLGSNGILPIHKYLSVIRQFRGKESYWLAPSLFWINDSDRSLIALVWAGIACSIALMLGFYPTLMLFLLYILFLSLVNTGQDFLSFGWDVMLLELTFNSFCFH